MLANQISWYLYGTNRVLKAIELSKEELFLLDHKTLKNAEKKLVAMAKLGAYGTIFLGYVRTKQTGLAIDTGRATEGNLSLVLATCYEDYYEFNEAKEFGLKALSIATETGRKDFESHCYFILARILRRLGEHVTAKEFQEKALAIAQEIGDKETEAEFYELLGGSYIDAWVPGQDLVKAKHYFERALVLRRETGDMEGEVKVHIHLSGIFLLERNFPEAKLHFSASIKHREVVRSFLKDHDQSKISYFDRISVFFQLLSSMLTIFGNRPREGLYTAEIGRARALEDLMSAQYSIENEISVSPETWVGIEKIMKKESNCVCLYISYINQLINLYVVKADKQVIVKIVNVTNYLAGKGSVSRVDDVFCSDIYRKVRCLAPEQCEDRSWFPSNIQQERKGESSQGNSLTAARPVEEDENRDDQQPILTLADGYKMIIAPIADWLDKPEIIIVPDRLFFKVPFAALKDEKGRCLSESFRIRIAPSLTTLKLIQNSPSDYHSQTGALIEGDPDVGEVLYKGNLHPIKRLPFAGEEAKMVGELIGTQPLLGKQATKQMVLQRINSVSLIHFACHGDAERGEIILASPPLTERKPNEKDYLLMMGEISKVRLRAKLVVLSCCHSAQGQICSEGVVGIARAFIGSGARSVLVALWAIQDEATKHFMSCFYKHLVRGESASESLHQAMKWMRENGFSDVEQWAPFMLIGDSVTLDFQKLRLVSEMYGNITKFKLMMNNAFPAYQGIHLIWVKRLVSIETLALHWPGEGGGGGRWGRS